MRILIADDEMATRRLVEAILTKVEHEVVVAKDGNEAWKILQQPDAPQLAILDWMMPGMDGIKICHMLRDREGGEYTYIIMLSAKNETRDLVAALNAGADDYLSKPFDPDELHARVRAGERAVNRYATLRAGVACPHCGHGQAKRAA
ncbi:MAG TPA: response regulator transcription factor [Burkholderiales bacterium]|nr:response regulator transcription factor [Burkholderiales bacterium]